MQFNKGLLHPLLSPCRREKGLGEKRDQGMPTRNIVIGQKVDQAKVERAKELRKNLTPEERILWQRLRANRLDGWHFRRQQIIDGFIVDFYCHKAA